ncbi:sugar kinase [Noviherbaspirillum sp. CPCC 100848]|uniref:Sugar kinase n=1 Tax=Noviherbaspirillum album TaxID=3080276 RepID=A0ABU6JI38_9BURK|nr:sugar kinase [Noviherbaspirillum sp. CPCC 100848]MEC4723126.1 sugar kinase [Noviherbaspirillum sp. CPCC 100848]
MIELRPTAPATLMQSFAGDVYNTAVYFRRLSPQWPSQFISCVGEDHVSDALMLDAGSHGLDTTLIRRVADRHPGLYWITTSASGERSFLYWRGFSAARMMLDENQEIRLRSCLADCGLFYFSGITLSILQEPQRERLLNLASDIRSAGGIVAFDSNYRASLWESKEAAVDWSLAASRTASHLLVTEDDEAALHGDATPADTLARALELGAVEVVVKMGARGCLLQSEAMDEALRVPAVQANVVDTTAAGDSFNAAYLAARTRGLSPLEAARSGCSLAARVVAFPGAIIPADAMP